MKNPSSSHLQPWIGLFVILALSISGLNANANSVRYQPDVEKLEAKTLECDLAVYGGTPAGVTAAIQAARLGKSVIFISFNGFVGGMTSGGLTATDLGEKESIGGMALEFYKRVGNLKGFKPSKAESLYRAMIEESKLTLLLNRPLVSAKIESGRIIAIGLQSGETVRARMFIDATYEGDLLAAANVSYQVGRE
ncbi:FAD-dependent oxidoreductase, partial [bacterium]|nr:FAD-dependent oxidoreductase [bacterium]